MTIKDKPEVERSPWASGKSGLNQHSDGRAHDNRILPATSRLALLILPFLLTAWVILYLLPQRTEDLFAWPINPSMTARLMGSGYLAGAYFFYRVAVGKTWQRVKNGFLPVTIFAGLMAVSTGLHWDRFTQGHISFYTWVAIYLITPVLVLAAWLHNRSTDPMDYLGRDARVPSGVRWMMGLVGVGMVIAVLFFYVRPEWMIAIWPWTLSPLTARACLGFFLLPAVTEIFLAFDARWSAHQTIIQGQIFALSLILLGAGLSWADFDPATGGWFLGALLFLLVSNLVLYGWMQAQIRQMPNQSTA